MHNDEHAWEERYAGIVRSGAHNRFFERVFMAQQIQSLIIVSPWIGSMTRQSVGYTIHDIADLITEKHIPSYIVMRSYQAEPTNLPAVEALRACPSVNLYFNNEVHAKVYVCRCDPFGFALLSSANLSESSMTSIEIGMMIEGKGYGESVVEDLEAFGKHDMLGMAGTSVDKYAKDFVDRL